MKRFMNDNAYRDLFFFTMVSVLHIGVPKTFPIVMLYFYFIAYIAHTAVFALGQFKFAFITYLVKNFFVFLIILSLLGDNWCDFFNYRGSYNNAIVKG
jgi:hypothetical protein